MPRRLLVTAFVLVVFVPLAFARSTNTVTITSGPVSTDNSKDASFGFSSTGAVTSFRCSLDGGSASACSSPQSYSGLGEGGHTFQVQGFRGSVGPIATDTRSWKIDLTAPDTTITTSVPSWVTATDLAIAFSATEPGTFRCRLDGAAWSACTSPRALSGLAQGAHSFDVAAVDSAGNLDPSPASAAWRVDTLAPDTKIEQLPAFTKLTAVQATLGASEAGVSYQCKLDGGAFAPCASPKALVKLAAGSHTLRAIATDAAGNSDPSPAVATWIVDTKAPVASIVLPTASSQLSSSFTVSWKATDPGSGIARYDVRVWQAGAWKQASGNPSPGRATGYVLWKSSPSIVGSTFKGALGTTYCFDVRARDKAGNVSSFSQDRCTTIPLNETQIELFPGTKSYWEQLGGTSYYLKSYARPKPLFGCGGDSNGALPGGQTWHFLDQLRCLALIVRLEPWSKAQLLVARCPTCGAIRVFERVDLWPADKLVPLGSKLELTSTSTLTKQKLALATTKGKQLTLAILSVSGRPRIDGLVVSRASVPRGDAVPRKAP